MTDVLATHHVRVELKQSWQDDFDILAGGAITVEDSLSIAEQLIEKFPDGEVRIVMAPRKKVWEDPEPWITEDGVRQVDSVVPYVLGKMTYAFYRPRTRAEYRAEMEQGR